MLLNAEPLLVMTVAVLLVALLYSSVGHAGASGYIAVMALSGFSPAVIKPTALALNIAVAAVASWQFRGFFRWPLFLPLALLSIPCAFLGGYISVPAHLFKMLTGAVLMVAAIRFVIHPAEDLTQRPPSLSVALSTGGGLGLLAGLTGTGGGIFLTPLMLLLRWAGTRTVAATSALFILVNSIAGLAGNLSSTLQLPLLAGPLLAVVLTLAGGKLIIT